MPPHHFSWGGDCPPCPPYGALPVLAFNLQVPVYNFMITLMLQSGSALFFKLDKDIDNKGSREAKAPHFGKVINYTPVSNKNVMQWHIHVMHLSCT